MDSLTRCTCLRLDTSISSYHLCCRPICFVIFVAALFFSTADLLPLFCFLFRLVRFVLVHALASRYLDGQGLPFELLRLERRNKHALSQEDSDSCKAFTLSRTVLHQDFTLVDKHHRIRMSHPRLCSHTTPQSSRRFSHTILYRITVKLLLAHKVSGNC